MPVSISNADNFSYLNASATGRAMEMLACVTLLLEGYDVRWIPESDGFDLLLIAGNARILIDVKSSKLKRNSYYEFTFDPDSDQADMLMLMRHDGEIAGYLINRGLSIKSVTDGSPLIEKDFTSAITNALMLAEGVISTEEYWERKIGKKA